MGAGIAAVAGVENEPSSHRADIEEAQAELRQELTGRTERWRELEFLEKGGDPLEFKFGEPLPCLWSSSPTDPLVKHVFSSDGRGDANGRREENSDFSQEDGSDSKRARGLSGKFFYQDVSATSTSGGKTSPDAFPATVNSSVEHDRKDPTKKELDACKSNKVAVKGQYARRNRQRSNRFSNVLTASRESGKFGTESGESGKVGTESGSLSSSTVVFDAEAKDATRVQHVINDDVTLQTRDKVAEVTVVKEKERASAAIDLPVAATPLQGSSAHEGFIESHAFEALMLESTKETTGTENDEESKSLDQRPCLKTEAGRDISYSLISSKGGEEQDFTSSACISSKGGEGHDLLPSTPLYAQTKKVTIEESVQDFLPSVTKEEKMDVTETRLNAEGVTGPKGGELEGFVSGSGDATTMANKPVPVLDNQASLTKHLSNVVTTSLPPSEITKIVSTEDNIVVESVSPRVPVGCDIRTSEKVIQTKDESLRVKEIDTSLEKGINSCYALNQTQVPGEVKVKVEDEAPSHSVVLPTNVANFQEVVTLQPQHRADGSLNAVCDATVLDSKLPILSMPEQTELSVGDGIENISSPTHEKADKTSVIPEAEGCKDSVRDSDDKSKEKSFKEAPRKHSHWDFVLQEMAWLANDFMQERLWKIAAAAQLARWVVKEKKQQEFEEMEVHNRQRKLAQGLSKAVRNFWQSVEALLLKEAAGSDSTFSDKAQKVGLETKAVKPVSSSAQVHPVQSYAMRFLKDSTERQWIPQAEAPPTPDRVSEFGIFDFWEEHFPEASLFYTVPGNAMEAYRQSVVSHWEKEYEQRLQEHEATMSELGPHLAGSSLVTGKRSSGFLGGNQTNRGIIPTKRMRTSAVAARQRAAGGTGPLVSIPVVHFTRSDISSCDTNSQQDEMTGFVEGSSVSGRATDLDSSGAFFRNNLAVDGVDSPFKSKRKKKIRHLGGHPGLAGCERDSDPLWQHNHRQNEQKEKSKKKGDQFSLGVEGLGVTMGAYHGTTSITNANKLIKQIASRDRNRKHKVGKASMNQPGVWIPWSPVEDQAILGLVHELGLNWELVSDVLSAASHLRGIFRKPKDCKERYKVLTDKGGGDGGDSPDGPSSSAHDSISMAYKGGTRYLPQHLEETLKSHVDCILQLHQQLRSRKSQSETQEPKQLVPEHESHGIKHTAMTPLELCELSSANGELVPHSYSHQSAGVQSLFLSGVTIRPTSSAASPMQGVTNVQMSPSLSPSAAMNAAATRDAQRMGMPMRPTTAEEQRLRYSRMVVGRGLQTQGLPATTGPSLVSLPNTTDGTASANVSSGNSAGMMCSLSRGIPVAKPGLPGVGSMNVPNIAAGTISNPPAVEVGLSGAGAVNASVVSSPVNVMRRPREAISMGHSPSAALNNANSSLPNSVVSSPTQNFGVQQQLLQHSALQSQQQSSSSSQQQAYNMMRVAKERQQLQQQQQKRILQQQQSPTSSTLQLPFQSSQPPPACQQQHGLSPHAHLFPQQQPCHLMMRQHTLQEQQQQQQHAALPSSISQSAVSPSGQPSLSGSSQSSQQQQLSQAHQPTPTASPSQSPFQSKHLNPTVKMQQQQHQGKNLKGVGRGEVQPNMVLTQIPGQSMSQGQCMGDSQGVVPQHLAGGSSAQNIPANFLHVSDSGAQPFPQKVFSQHKHTSQQHLTSMATSSSAQPASPPMGGGIQQQQPSPGPGGSTQRRAGQQSQGQQRRPQQSQVGMSLGTQPASQSTKIGLQASSLPSQLPAGYQLGANPNTPLSIASPSGGVPLSSPSNSGSGGFSSGQWKAGQAFTPMAAGLYNLSRSNSGIAAQAPHLAMSVGMHLPLPNGKVPATGNSLVTQDLSRPPSQHASAVMGTLPQKASAAPVLNSRQVSVAQQLASPQQRQLAQQQQQQQQAGQHLRPASSGTAPASE